MNSFLRAMLTQLGWALIFGSSCSIIYCAGVMLFDKKQPTFAGIRGSFLLGFITSFFSGGSSE
jgi:hypothetical protein